METVINVPVSLDADAARALESQGRREAANRYLSGLLRDGRVQDILAETIAEEGGGACKWTDGRSDRRAAGDVAE